jgi:serine/threonine protein phosphatase PrpC
MHELLFNAGGKTDSGARHRNEDLIVIESDLGLYAVFDGMGGEGKGELAARLASDALVEYIRRRAGSKQFSRRELLEAGIAAASEGVFHAARQVPAGRKMGTTIVACLTQPTGVVIGHVGDSRAYLLRDGSLAALTRDHSLTQEFIDTGRLSPARRVSTWQRHLLTRYLGLPVVKAEMLDMSLEVSDRLLLCSDGLYGCVPPEFFQAVLQESDTAQAVSHRLVDQALKGHHVTDNVSVVVLDVWGKFYPGTVRRDGPTDGDDELGAATPRDAASSTGSVSHSGELGAPSEAVTSKRRRGGRPAVLDVVGRKFGRLTVLARDGNPPLWRCRCTCGESG